jgi:hypothetical protein
MAVVQVRFGTNVAAHLLVDTGAQRTVCVWATRNGRTCCIVDRVADTEAQVEVRVDRVDGRGRRQVLMHLSEGEPEDEAPRFYRAAS